MSAPKALNIIRLDQHEKSLLSKRSSKIINYHLHDPDQQKPQPLKKPVIKFYRPGNYNPTKQLINLHLSREKQVIHTTSNIPKQQQQQQYSIIQDNQVPRLVNGSDQDDDILPEARINRKVMISEALSFSGILTFVNDLDC
jgi:Golgi nucleoside diphosphatase